MPELLLELGCEELPAAAVRRAYGDLSSAVVKALEDAALGGEPLAAMGTPRRLIVAFANVKSRQEDQVKEQRGPALKAAYDEAGEPTPALLGFCRSSGVDPSQLRKDDQYVWASRSIAGKEAAEILSEALPKAIRSLAFDKTMRWGSGRMRFARPIRWIVALLDGEVIPFEIEGVRTSNRSRGHRFYAPEEFEIKSLQNLTSELRGRKVEPDPNDRRASIEAALKQVASGNPQVSQDLLDENVFLTEWPAVVEGSFPETFLELPKPVLVTAMAKHEKMFPIESADGALLDRFLFVRNAGEEETVRKGAEWVLSARFNDAKFFHDEDRKSTLADFLEKTAGIVFAEKLGTVRQRAARLAELAEFVAHQSGADETEQALARSAGLYAKADLSTGLVSEMASLQGVIGGEYARREGMPEPVCQAIAAQYDPSKVNAETSEGRTALRLVMADQLDKLAGYLGIGLPPTGSSDPYGLRRAATVLIEVAWRWSAPLPPFSGLLAKACEIYKTQGIQVDADAAGKLLADIFASRYEALLSELRHDVLEAALLPEFAHEVTSPQRVKLRTEMMAEFLEDTPFIQTATRPINIVAAAKKKRIPYELRSPLSVDKGALDSPDAVALLEMLQAQQPQVEEALASGNGPAVIRAIQSLGEPINRFFDSTMVMAEDDAVRHARLSLMWATSLQLFAVGDFSKLVIEG